VSGSLNDMVNSISHPMNSQDENTRRVYFLSDYVHLVKCLRNNLLTRGQFKVKRPKYFGGLLLLCLAGSVSEILEIVMLSMCCLYSHLDD
jgi:hypothetical protein